MKKPCQDNRSLRRDSKQLPSQYKSEVLKLGPTCSIYDHKT
jgi:hypothetical protein